jgi:hypothetical protein
MLEIKMNVGHPKEGYDMEPLLERIKVLLFCIELFGIQLGYFEEFCKEMMLEYGESQYKTCKQRYFAINLYHELIPSLLPKLNAKNKFAQHLEAVLNLIAMFTTTTASESELIFKQDSKIAKKVSDICFELLSKAYTFGKEDHFSEREEERVVIARMMEFTYDHLEEPLGLAILLAALRARVSVLRLRSKQKEQCAGDENLFEETLYEMYRKLTEL